MDFSPFNSVFAHFDNTIRETSNVRWLNILFFLGDVPSVSDFARYVHIERRVKKFKNFKYQTANVGFELRFYSNLKFTKKKKKKSSVLQEIDFLQFMHIVVYLQYSFICFVRMCHHKQKEKK